MHVFLDFDGTLADSSQGIYAAFAAACRETGVDIPNYDQFCTYIGPPVQVIVKKLVPNIEDDLLESFRSKFRLEYDHKFYSMIEWYEGVVAGLNSLALKENTQLSIITNKPTDPTKNIVQKAGMESLFSLIIGIDYRAKNNTGSSFHSKSEAIRHAISLTKCSLKEAVYVGDTPSDRMASQEQKIRFIAATYGFHRWQQVELKNTTAASNFEEVIAKLR